MPVERARIVVLLVLASAWAGCAQPEPAQGEGAPGVVDLEFPPLLVQNTPQEAREAPSRFFVSYAGVLTGMGSPESAEFPTALVRDGSAVFVSYAGQKWTRYEWADPALAGVAAQVAAYDLRLLLTHPSYAGVREPRGDVEVWRGTGVVDEPDVDVPYEVVVEARAGKVVRATVVAPTARESPFTFTPLAEPFPFPVAVPQGARAWAELVPLEAEAREAHVALIGLVEAYARNHAGLLPETLDETTLRLELATTGASWPRNPYRDAPLSEGVSEGHFGWTRCAPDRGYYVAYGWDALLLEERWGVPQCS